MVKKLSICLLLSLFVCSQLVSGSQIPDEDWAYSEVRPGANMFWWLYGKEDVSTRDQAPLVMWLQGGPGGSSTGIGNFYLIGPKDTDLNPREQTWIKEANVLFVDNPVGTGYSYVTDSSKYTTDVDQIASDLLRLMKDVLEKHPTLEKTPFWVFSESYGGKMAAAFGRTLHTAIRRGEIRMDFKGVALGDAWNHPMDFVNEWAPYLFSVGQIDEKGYENVKAAADRTQRAVNEGKWRDATNLWALTENVIMKETEYCDFYNILKPRPARYLVNETMAFSDMYSMSREMRIMDGIDNLPTLMNGPIREKLGVIPPSVRWGGQSNQVFDYQSGDFMKPNVDTVVDLLNLDVTVVVYTGNLDLICCSTGTLRWMRNMKWGGTRDWLAAPRKVLAVNGMVQGFTKHYKNLKFYQFLTAGHMVPADQPDAGYLMLKQVLTGRYD